MTVYTFAEQEIEPAALDVALRECGGFFVQASAADLLDCMLSATATFFALSRAQKIAFAIERSPNFRGWSEMSNARDWREQLHLGRERSASEHPIYRRLEGPNLWPHDTAWRNAVSSYMGAMTSLGRRLLESIACALGVAPTSITAGDDDYWVAKLIAYHPQPSLRRPRLGVAAHVDFSWLTITLQDSAGLEVLPPERRWLPVQAAPGTVWVHVGELLQHATAGRYVATPHRVINQSPSHTRLSVPVFINPPLDAVVPVLLDPSRSPARPITDATDHHVHSVLQPRTFYQAFHFGTAEWQRKGRGRWCHACCRSDRDT